MRVFLIDDNYLVLVVIIIMLYLVFHGTLCGKIVDVIDKKTYLLFDNISERDMKGF